MWQQRLTQAWEWIKTKASEHSTYDGIVILALSLSVLLFDQLIELAAWVGVLYGAYTIVRSERWFEQDDQE